MTVHDKINIRANAIWYLRYNQYQQLIERNLMVLAPYYNSILRRQASVIQDAENFKLIFGKSRYDYENNIKQLTL